MINKQLKEIKGKLEIIEKLMQDNVYLDNLDKGLEYQNKEIERLNNIIKEAIEYIESYMPNYDFDKTNLIKLSEILQGSDKE